MHIEDKKLEWFILKTLNENKGKFLDILKVINEVNRFIAQDYNWVYRLYVKLSLEFSFDHEWAILRTVYELEDKGRIISKDGRYAINSKST
ncbi:MAG: hypothetical protein A3B96_02400 [Candidatus Spechtbacteria bacterium RIFCSPHIGHO2_02_FULL_43_15b]|nr:MAG: hypothetical protein A3B96_02400 [Candidatus Spechtbacteria bacterium RIFCSPHIGHO2_02_FULL_43_15b]